MSKTFFDPTPKPEGLTGRRVSLIFSGSERSLRDSPTTMKSQQTGTLRTGEVVTIFDPARYDFDRRRWNWIESEKGNGWLCTDAMSFASAKIDTTTVTAVEMPAVRDEAPAILSERDLLYALAAKLTEAVVLLHQLAEKTSNVK